MERLIPIAEGRGISMAELSLAWAMQAPGVDAYRPFRMQYYPAHMPLVQ